MKKGKPNCIKKTQKISWIVFARISWRQRTGTSSNTIAAVYHCTCNTLLQVSPTFHLLLLFACVVDYPHSLFNYILSFFCWCTLVLFTLRSWLSPLNLTTNRQGIVLVGTVVGLVPIPLCKMPCFALSHLPRLRSLLCAQWFYRASPSKSSEWGIRLSQQLRSVSFAACSWIPTNRVCSIYKKRWINTRIFSLSC